MKKEAAKELMWTWKKVHITTIGTLEKAAILTIARAQESSHDKQDCDVAVNSDMH